MSDVMKELMEKRKLQQQQAEDAQNFTPIDFVQAKFMGITDKLQAFRPIGLPFPLRKKPTDSKFLLTSKVLRDDGSGYSIIRWAVTEKNGQYIPDDKFPLMKMYKLVTKKEWIDYPEPKLNRTTGKTEKGYYNYFYKDTDSFLKTNTKFGNAKKGEEYPPQFYPSGGVVMNVIDRMNDWCKTNKKSKVITRSVGLKDYKQEDGTTKTVEFVNFMGIPASTNRSKYLSVYDKLEDLCMETSGSFEDCDYITKKVGKEYEISNTIKGVYNDIPEVKDFISFETGLTDEEKTYELWDLDELFNDCVEIQCYKLMKSHTGLLKLFDAEIGIANGVNIYDEVAKLGEIGGKMISEKIKKSKEANATAEPKVEETKPVKEKKEEKPTEPVKNERPARGTTEAPKEESIVDQCVKNFPKWAECDEADQFAYVSKISRFENGKPVWKDDEIVNIIKCDKGCGVEIPNMSYVCASCGYKY